MALVNYLGPCRPLSSGAIQCVEGVLHAYMKEWMNE